MNTKSWKFWYKKQIQELHEPRGFMLKKLLFMNVKNVEKVKKHIG